MREQSVLLPLFLSSCPPGTRFPALVKAGFGVAGEEDPDPDLVPLYVCLSFFLPPSLTFFLFLHFFPLRTTVLNPLGLVAQ